MEVKDACGLRVQSAFAIRYYLNAELEMRSVTHTTRPQRKIARDKSVYTMRDVKL